MAVTGPSLPTIKRLFAVSGNQCAFPKCNNFLVDPGSKKVTGKICHIKASSPEGPRDDPQQSDEERHSFDNLLLLCPIHHDVVDADPESYTVQRLQKIKADHEQSHSGGVEPTEDVARQLLLNVSITHGSIIYAPNQMGGQAAHSITNIGPQPRRITQAAAEALISKLQQHPGQKFEIEVVSGDAEAQNLGHLIHGILTQAGWECTTFAHSQFPFIPRNLTISFSSENELGRVLAEWAGAAGLKSEAKVLPKLDKIHILVGTLI